MKKLLLSSLAFNFILLTFFLVTCNKSDADARNQGSHGAASSLLSSGNAALPASGLLAGLPVASRPISITQADSMITSYLTAVNYTVNTSESRSFLLDADSLRNYAADKSIVYFKVFLAHSMDYIHAGYYGKRPEPNQNALTLIFAGVNNDGDYVLLPTNMVLDGLLPCPPECIPRGSASKSTL